MEGCLQRSSLLTVFLLFLFLGAACSEDNRADAERDSSPLDTTYWIDGRAFDLKNGRSEVAAAPGSATVITTTVYGPFATGDLNGDGLADTAVILMHDPGGSGTFFYVAAAVKEGGRYHGTRAVLLGDRIEPDEIVIENSVIDVKYRDRLPGESMGAEVSVDKTTRFVLIDDRLEKVAKADQGGEDRNKIDFDLSRLDENGLQGPADGKRAIAYEFCIPDTDACRNEVKSIDSSVEFSSGSPGRVGCSEGQVLCIGSTHQQDFRDVLKKLTQLHYVQHIGECFFE